MKIDIIIGSCKPREELSSLVCMLRQTTENNIIVNCSDASAAVNRNAGASRSDADIIIFCDDDIRGFYEGWDLDLVEPMLSNDSIVLSSVRILWGNREIAYVCGDLKKDVSKPYLIVPDYVPSACIAVYNDGIRFDEEYLGSGVEDLDYIEQLRQKYPGCEIIINNKCRLVHLNEQKKQMQYWHQNAAIFKRKWGINL